MRAELVSLARTGTLRPSPGGELLRDARQSPPQYSKAEEEFRKAATPAERLETLREMFRLLPKHKGTEKLQSDLKQKISRAKDEIEGAQAGGKKAGVEPSRPARGGRARSCWSGRRTRARARSWRP